MNQKAKSNKRLQNRALWSSCIHQLVCRGGVVLSIWVSPNLLNAQDPMVCGGVIDAFYENAATCTRTSEAWDNVYRLQSSYVPGEPLNTGLTKYVKIAVHVWQKNDATGNYAETQQNIDDLYLAVQNLTGLWANNEPATDPISGTPFIPDTRLRADLKGIYFHQNSTVWAYTCMQGNDATNALINQYPAMGFEKVINLHLLNPNSCNPWGAAGAANSPALGQFFQHSSVASNGGLGTINIWALPQHWAHEIGHNMDLYHTYYGPAPNNYCGGIEYCTTANPDYLTDVFGPVVQPWCTATPLCSSCEVCMHDAGWECVQNDPVNTCTNNMMGGTNAARYYSPLQMGRMHRALSTYSVRKYAWGYSQTPYEVTADEIWDFNIKVYQDIVIKEGATLTIQCVLEMVPEAGIIVEQGARLVIDGGKVTAAQYSDSFWRGIQVWGTSGQHQFPSGFPTHQGMVILKNDAIIEHAREAITTWRPGDWNSMGGVVQVQGTEGQAGGTFLNCRRSVEFMAYQNFHPNNPFILRLNQSYFNDAHFRLDDDYRGVDDFYAHVTMWKVDGIFFRACDFENEQTTIPQSSQLGKGILSIDANYTVTGRCNIVLPYGTPCPENELDRGTFAGLGHGIHALDGGSGRGFTADRLTFENNVVGVYGGGVPMTVTRNQFVLGDRNVWMDEPVEEEFQEPFHRGISTQQSSSFRIEENSFHRATNPTSEGNIAIVVENSGANNTQVFKNEAFDMEAGYIGEGRCIDFTQASSIGHQFICNTNNGNEQNFWARKEDQDQLDWMHSIRTQQGSDVSPAGNTFDQETGVMDASDYKNETEWVINYWHSGGQSEPLDVTPGWVGATLATGNNNCPSRFNGRDVKLTEALITQVGAELDAAKTAYINTAYVFNNLLDGGNTDAVVQEVEQSWPQDAWDLRDYLLSRSPYLSTEVLMEMMRKNIMPQAMELEICLANPEATKKEGFIRWAEYEAPNPLPSYMIDLIAGSWAPKTFRMQLEAQMGQHHADMSIAADLLQASFRADEDDVPVDEMLTVWQAMPNYGARYSETQIHLRQGDFNSARAVMNGLTANYPMKEVREVERDRTLWYIDQLESLHTGGRTTMQLDSAEVAQWLAFAEAAHDLPGSWARNVLCFGYSLCPYGTGGTAGGNKMLRPSTLDASVKEQPVFNLHPNPANAWVAITYRIPGEGARAFARIIDARGREVQSITLPGTQGQHVWDSRTVPAGVYSVELFNGTTRVATQRVVIQPSKY